MKIQSNAKPFIENALVAEYGDKPTIYHGDTKVNESGMPTLDRMIRTDIARFKAKRLYFDVDTHLLMSKKPPFISRDQVNPDEPITRVSVAVYVCVSHDGHVYWVF